MVADQRLTPTFTADLAVGLLDAVRADARGLLTTNSGACSWYEFTEAIVEQAGLEVAIEPLETAVPPGGARRPLGVLATRRADGRADAAQGLARRARDYATVAALTSSR